MFKKNLIGSVLALISMVGFLAVLAFLLVQSVPEGNRDFFNISLGALIGFASTAIQHYLGSSKGSADKTDLLKPSSGQ